MRKARFTKPLSVSFTPEVYESIKTFTDDEGISMSDLVRAIINKELPRVIADPLNWGFEEEEKQAQ